MKVQMKVPMAGVHEVREVGQVIDVDDDEAARLIAADFAAEAEETPEEPKAEPKKSARKRQAPKVETATDKTPVETPED